jgi:hypothetical protein
LESRNYRHLSSGEPTYWPTDLNKLPDLLDFCITKGIHSNFATAKSCFELSSDHSPVLVSLSTPTSLSTRPLTHGFHWKAAKSTKETTNFSLAIQTARGTWARTTTEKAQTFAEHLESIFQPHPSRNDQEEHLILELEIPHQLEPPPRRFRRSEVQAVINNFKAKRSPGYDLITGKILQELPPTAVKYLTQLFNAAMLIAYFPMQ